MKLQCTITLPQFAHQPEPSPIELTGDISIDPHLIGDDQMIGVWMNGSPFVIAKLQPGESITLQISRAEK